jgi:hypothetical protein
MTSRARGAVLALLAIGLALPARAGDDKDLKKARSELKKNETILQKADALEGDEAQKAALDAIPKIREAENEEAVGFLLAYAKVTPHPPVFDKIRDELGNFAHDDAMKAFVAVLSKKDKKAGWEQRALAADVSARVSNPKVIDGLLAALKDDDPNVLNPAIVASGKKQDKRVIGALVDLLKKVEKWGGWEYHHVRQALVELTGQDFFTFDTWKKWWDGNKDSFDFAKKGEAKEAKTQEHVGANEKKPTFFSTDIKSNRFCFVIDISGSMKMPDLPDNPDDPIAIQRAQDKEPTDEILKLARIERAKGELKKALANLDATARFNMLSFSDHFTTFSNDIVFANDQNKKAAIAWVENLKADGGTYTDDALTRAFEMRDIDTIYFLSDGAPQKQGFGKGEEAKCEEHQRKLMQTCYELIDKERRFRKITIHTFGLCGLGIWFKKWGERPPSCSLDPKSVEPLRDFMKKVAEMTGGDFKQL